MHKRQSKCKSDTSTLSTSYFQTVLERLKGQDVKSSTRNTYHKIWQKFNEFIIRLDYIPKSWERKLALYTTYLITECNIKSSTLKTYISAIKQTLIKDGYCWDDKSLLLNSLTKVCKLHNDHVITRLPIQHGLLDLILFQLGQRYNQQIYLEILYKSMFCVAYYGLLRVGEITQSPHNISVGGVFIAKEKRKLKLTLYSSKTHGKESRPQTIEIESVKKDRHTNFCPVDLTEAYSNLRRPYVNKSEPFYILPDGNPVSSQQFRKVLKTILTNLKLDETLYGTHSFRSGRATDLSKRGVSVDKIKQIGRWRSNAVYNYLKWS